MSKPVITNLFALCTKQTVLAVKLTFYTDCVKLIVLNQLFN